MLRFLGLMFSISVPERKGGSEAKVGFAAARQATERHYSRV